MEQAQSPLEAELQVWRGGGLQLLWGWSWGVAAAAAAAALAVKLAVGGECFHPLSRSTRVTSSSMAKQLSQLTGLTATAKCEL